MSTDSHKSLSTQVSHFDNVSRISDQVMQDGSARVLLHSMTLHYWFKPQSKYWKISKAQTYSIDMHRRLRRRRICFRVSPTKMENDILPRIRAQENNENYISFFFLRLFISIIMMPFIQKEQDNLGMESYFVSFCNICVISHDEIC